MQAVLLAGGLGTRLQSVVNDRPKPMALINRRPFLEYVVHELEKQGIRDIIFAVGYKGSMVEAHFGDGRDFGVTISYSYEEEPLGTAGAIKLAGQFIREDEFYVLNADTFYQIDYRRLKDLASQRSLEMALVLRKVADVSRYGEAVLTDGWLTAFNEKSSEARPGTINGGIYLLKRSLLDSIPAGKVSLENEIIPRLLAEKKPVGGIINEGYFIDIGVPADYFQFIRDVEEEVVKW